MTNRHAAALARLGKGKKKTMSEEALRQRRNAIKARWDKQKKKGKK